MLGELGWSIDDFYDADFRMATNAIIGMMNARFEDIKNQYEIARYNAALNINVHLPKGKSIKNPKELGEFSWEKPTSKKKNLTKEQLDSIMEKMESPKIVKKEKLDGRELSRFTNTTRT